MDKKLLNIVIIGMPGSGKTTVGTLLAQKLNKEFIDIDKYIEVKEKASIPELFQKGEQYFRDRESEAVRDVSNKCDVIISTGGGVIKRKENIEALKQHGIVVFIDRSVENIIGDIDTDSRPLLKENVNALYNLHKERYPLYKSYNHIHVTNAGSINNLVEELILSINRYISKIS